MSKKLTFTFAVVHWQTDFEGTISGTYTDGSPAVMYLRNGDPGYPADPAEFEVEEVILTDVAGQKLAEPIVLDTKGTDEFAEQYQDKILQWAIDEYEDCYDGPADPPER